MLFLTEVDSVFDEVQNKNCTLLGYYVASSGNFFPTFRYNLSVTYYQYSLRNAQFSCTSRTSLKSRNVKNTHTQTVKYAFKITYKVFKGSVHFKSPKIIKVETIIWHKRSMGFGTRSERKKAAYRRSESLLNTNRFDVPLFPKNKDGRIFFLLANPFQFQEDCNGLLYRAMQTHLNSRMSANRSKSMEHKNKGYCRKELRLAL